MPNPRTRRRLLLAAIALATFAAMAGLRAAAEADPATAVGLAVTTTVGGAWALLEWAAQRYSRRADEPPLELVAAGAVLLGLAGWAWTTA